MYSVPDHPVIRNMELTGYPDGKEPRVCCWCDECGGEIYEGQTYYKIGSNIYCEDCIDDARSEAGYDE